jgi:predicted TIM-barrel fold metal-dependent hydrolase
VPEGFPNKLTKKISETKIGYGLLKFALQNANPFTRSDAADKLLTFIKEGRKASQREVFLDMAKHYPKETMFVILTMDMNYMGCGRPQRSFIEQLYELDRLRDDFNIIPFIHLDCRRGNMYRFFDEFVVKRGWGGVKMYPPLGTMPQDKRYESVYMQLVALNKPIISHCTYGNPIHFRGAELELKKILGEKYDKKASRKENCDKLTDPYNWQDVVLDNPGLRVCLAHSGGLEYWLKWYEGDESLQNPFNKCRWLATTDKGIYLDISYTLADKRCIPILKMMLRDEGLKNKILFGSDYYMSLNECSEKEWSVNLRAQLTEQEWQLISYTNPRAFLYG